MRRSLGVILAAALSFVSWSYEQDFEGLSAGDLNGQDSWSGNTDYDVTTAEQCGGTKSVGLTIGTSQLITRAFSDVQDGDFYIRARRTGTSDGDAYILLREDASNKVFVKIGENGDIEAFNGTTYEDTLASYSANVCYTLNIQFNDATQPDQWRIRTHDGSSWGSFTSWIGTNGGYGSINNIGFDSDSGASSQVVYFDTISLSDPSGGGGGGGGTTKNLTLLGVGRPW